MNEIRNAKKSVYGVLSKVVAQQGSKIAICFADEQITYNDLLRYVDNAANRLTEAGVGRGDFFAAYSPNRPEILYCYYAAAKIGAIFVPINPNMTAAEVKYSCAHSGARILFCDKSTAPIVSESIDPDRILSIEDIKNPVAVDSQQSFPEVSGDGDFLTIYTSGTTGTPKAIVLSHAAQINAPASLNEMWDIRDTDTTLVALPLGYLYGLSTAAAAALQQGATIVILPKFHPRDVLDSLVSRKISVFHGVPTMYSMMLEYCEQRDLSYDLSQVKKLICAGSPLSDELRKRFEQRFGQSLQDYYAMTECTPIFGKYAADDRPIPAGAIGRVAPGATVKVYRPDMSECGPGETGEFHVRGAATLSYYLKDLELTRASIDAEGLFRSGDLGCYDSDGFYYILGRAKDTIIRGGANISPSEVEQALASHPAIQEVCVLGAPNRIFGEVPVAFVVLRRNVVATSEDLIEHAGKTLSDFKIPKTYYFEQTLPIGKTGKIDRADLKKRLLSIT